MADACFHALENHVSSMMQEHHIVGAAIAVKREGRSLYEGTFGFRDLTTHAKVTPDTIFGLASVSKSFGAMAILQLAERGMLCIDDPVVKHLPVFRIHGIEDMSTVRLHHLLSHTTGLPPFKRRQGEFSQLTQHLDYIGTADYELLGKPGQYFSYCNDSFIMLGAVVESLTGMKYSEYVQANIFDPIGMRRSTYGPVSIPEFGEDVTGLYNYNAATGTHEPQQWPNLGSHYVSGGIRSSVRDLADYASVYAMGGMADGHRILSEHSVWRIRQPVIEVGRNSYYCYGLQTMPGYSGVTLASHGGSLPGVASHFGFVPEKQLAVAVLTNVSAVPSRALWVSAVNAALGLPLDSQPSVEPQWDAPVDALKRLTGRYSSSEGALLKVFLDGTGIKVENQGETFSARASDDSHLVITAHGQEMVLRFFSKDDGNVWAVLAGSRMLRRTGD